MKDTIWNKKIPTLLGLFIISLAILGTTFLVGQRTFFTQEASQNTDPQEIRITNVTDTSFTVSYHTTSPAIGSLNFGKNALTQTIIDEKDKNALIEHKTHSFTVKNLSPSTKYFFTIVSGQNTYQNNGAPYEVETASKIEAKRPSGFLVGKLTTEQGIAPTEAIVYMTSQGAAPLSTTMKNDGTYTISFENLRTESLDSFFQLNSTSVIRLLVISDKGTSRLTTSAKDIVNVPTIVVSRDYDFIDGEEETATASAKIEDLPNVSNTKSPITPKITSPQKDQELSTSQPVFRGTGLPNDKIKITIQSSHEIQGEVTVDSRGNWTFKPATPLEPGQHTITIAARDSAGILRTISQTFTIEGAEAAVAPSTTPTPTPTPTPAASPSASASASPIFIPTPTPILINSPTPVPTLPPAGSSQVTTGVMGIAITVLGAVLFVLSRLLL